MRLTESRSSGSADGLVILSSGAVLQFARDAHCFECSTGFAVCQGLYANDVSIRQTLPLLERFAHRQAGCSFHGTKVLCWAHKASLTTSLSVAAYAIQRYMAPPETASHFRPPGAHERPPGTPAIAQLGVNSVFINSVVPRCPKALLHRDQGARRRAHQHCVRRSIYRRREFGRRASPGMWVNQECSHKLTGTTENL